MSAGDDQAGEPTDPAGPAPTRAGSARWMLLGTAVLWGSAGLLIRATPLAGPQLAFWRSLAGAVVYQVVLTATGRRPSLAHLRTALVAGIGFGASLVLQFVAYKTTTLVSANVIFAIQPIILGVVAYRLHGARHGKSAVAATLLAVGGTAVVVAGSTSSGAWSLGGDLAAVAATVVGCLYPIGIKSARGSMGTLELQAAVLWVSAAVALPVAAATGPGLAPPSGSAWLWIAAIVAVGGTGHLLFTAAQHHVSVMASTTITLLEIVVVALGAALFFHQPVTLEQVAGIVIVSGAVGWWVAWVERPL